MSDTSPPTPRRGRRALRVLLAVAFAVVGVAAVWQGFGLVGYGTDDHPLRNAAAFAPLFVAGLVLFRPRTNWGARVLACAAALGVACAVWWFVPSDADGMSLRDAVARRDQLRARLADPSPDEIESGIATKLQIDRLQFQYRDLARPLDRDLNRWGQAVAEASVARLRQIPLDDVPAARAFEERLRLFATHFPAAGRYVGAAVDEWIDRATALRRSELDVLPRGDWAAFDRTAPARRALAEIGPAMVAAETREVLANAENDWVSESVEALVERNGEIGTRAEVWRAIEADVLALQSLDAEDDRFKAARGRLFDLAHAAASSVTDRLIQAGRTNAALGVARKHAVEWNATATVLGVRDVRRLDALRERCAALVKPGVADPDPADEPDIAPPPRAKP